MSHGEKIISLFLDKYKIQYVREQKFEGYKNKTRLRFDFYLSQYNCCIEYFGEQHF